MCEALGIQRQIRRPAFSEFMGKLMEKYLNKIIVTIVLRLNLCGKGTKGNRISLLGSLIASDKNPTHTNLRKNSRYCFMYLSVVLV